MLTTLSHLCQHGIAECCRSLELTRTRTLLESLLNDAVTPWLNQANDDKKVGGRRKAAQDGARMEKMCTVEEAKQLVFDSFCDLAIVAEKAEHGLATNADLDSANVAMAGNVFAFIYEVTLVTFSLGAFFCEFQRDAGLGSKAVGMH